MSSLKESEIQAVASTSHNAVQVSTQSIAPAAQTCPQSDSRPDDRWHVAACIRACGGDHTAGLVLDQLLYWWPKKYANHRGVKKSVADWTAELMLGEKPVRRINAKLKALGYVEIYLDTWGRYKSDATFYVLTPKALALLKAPLPTGGVVVKAPLPTGVVHKVPKPFTENTKKQKDFVAALPATESQTLKPETTSGENGDSKSKPETLSLATPGEGEDSKSKPETESTPDLTPVAPAPSPGKPKGLWETLMREFHSEQAVRVPGENKMLRDLRKDLDAEKDLPESAVVVRFLVERWYSWAPSGVHPRPQYLTVHRGLALEYFRKFYESPEQAAAKQAAHEQYLANAAAESAAAKAAAPAAPAHVSEFVLAKMAAAKTAPQATCEPATPMADPCPCEGSPPASEPVAKPVVPMVVHHVADDDYDEDGYTQQERLDAMKRMADLELGRLMPKSVPTTTTKAKPVPKPASNMLFQHKAAHAKSAVTAT